MFLEPESVESDLATFVNEKRCDVLVVMTLSVDKNNHPSRQLALYSIDDQLRNKVGVKFSFKLHHVPMHSHASCMCDVTRQNQAFVAEMSYDILRKNETLYLCSCALSI